MLKGFGYLKAERCSPSYDDVDHGTFRPVSLNDCLVATVTKPVATIRGMTGEINAMKCLVDASDGFASDAIGQGLP